MSRPRALGVVDGRRRPVLLVSRCAAQPRPPESPFRSTAGTPAQGRRLRAERPLVGGVDPGVPWGLQPRPHPARGLREPPVGHPRSRRRLPAPSAQRAAPPRKVSKRKDLIREMLDNGAELVREGGSHTIFRNRRTGHLIPVPRHADIGESLARKIARDAKR